MNPTLVLEIRNTGHARKSTTHKIGFPTPPVLTVPEALKGRTKARLPPSRLPALYLPIDPLSTVEHVLVQSIPEVAVLTNLSRELFRAKPEGGDHLLSTLPVLQIPITEEHDLADQGVVRHHHSHGSEEGFQIVGKRGSPSIARIHRNKYRKFGVDEDVRLGAAKEQDRHERQGIEQPTRVPCWLVGARR